MSVVTAPDDGSMTLTNGTGSVTLKHGQSITFNQLPSGTQYVVTETPVTAYTAACEITNSTVHTTGTPNTGSVTGATATGQLNNNGATAAFTNTMKIAPPTGVLLDIWPYLLMLVIVAAGVVTGLVVRSRKKHGSRSREDKDHEGL